MTDFRTIEIDFEVHKKIELERRSFDDSPNTALRRLLKIPTEGDSTQSARAKPLAERADRGRAWSGKGVILPHGTELKLEYKGRVYTGTVQDGMWFVQGDRFKSPSAAARDAIGRRNGQRESLDAWSSWQVKRPDDKGWITLSELLPPK